MLTADIVVVIVDVVDGGITAVAVAAAVGLLMILVKVLHIIVHLFIV